MAKLSSPATACGLATGVAFFLHASVPGSRSFPFIWPLLGGIVASVLVHRRGEHVSFAHALSVGARVGGIAAVVAIVLIVPAVLFFLHRVDLVAPIVVTGAATAGVIIACLLVIPVAIIGAAATQPFVRGSVARS